MKQLLEEADALEVLSYLRQYKPLIVTASREVTESDFGRLILLNPVTDITLTLASLTRSGSFKVGLIGDSEESYLTVPVGTIDLNTGNSDSIDPNVNLSFSGISSGVLNRSKVKIFNCFYDQPTDQWYLDIQTKETAFTGNPDITESINPDGNTLVRRSDVGAISANAFISIYDTYTGTAADILDRSMGFVCYQGDRRIQSSSDVNKSMALDFVTDGTGSVMYFSSRALAGEGTGSYNLVDVINTKFANDAAAAVGGIAVGEIYETTANKFRSRMA